MAIFSWLFFTSNKAGQLKTVTQFHVTLGAGNILLFHIQAEKIGTGNSWEEINQKSRIVTFWR